MNAVHMALVMSWRGDEPPSNRRLETMINSILETQKAKALVWQREREKEVVVFREHGLLFGANDLQFETVH